MPTSTKRDGFLMNEETVGKISCVRIRKQDGAVMFLVARCDLDEHPMNAGFQPLQFKEEDGDTWFLCIHGKESGARDIVKFLRFVTGVGFSHVEDIDRYETWQRVDRDENGLPITK